MWTPEDHQLAALRVFRAAARKRDACIRESAEMGIPLSKIALNVGLSYSQVCRIVGKR